MDKYLFSEKYLETKDTFSNKLTQVAIRVSTIKITIIGNIIYTSIELLMVFFFVCAIFLKNDIDNVFVNFIFRNKNYEIILFKIVKIISVISIYFLLVLLVIYYFVQKQNYYHLNKLITYVLVQKFFFFELATSKIYFVYLALLGTENDFYQLNFTDFYNIINKINFLVCLGVIIFSIYFQIIEVQDFNVLHVCTSHRFCFVSKILKPSLKFSLFLLMIIDVENKDIIVLSTCIIFQLAIFILEFKSNYILKFSQQKVQQTLILISILFYTLMMLQNYQDSSDMYIIYFNMLVGCFLSYVVVNIQIEKKIEFAMKILLDYNTQTFQDKNIFELACYVVNLLQENLKDKNLQNILLKVNGVKNFDQLKKTTEKLFFLEQKTIFLKNFFKCCIEEEPQNKQINFLYMEFLYKRKSFYELSQYITVMKYRIQRNLYYKKALIKILMKTQQKMNNIYEKNQQRNNILEFLNYTDLNNCFLNEVFQLSKDLSSFYKTLSLQSINLESVENQIQNIITRDKKIFKMFQKISNKFVNEEMLILYYDLNDMLLYNEERRLQLKDKLKYSRYNQQKISDYSFKDLNSKNDPSDGIILIRGQTQQQYQNYGQIKYVSNSLEKIFDVNIRQFKGNIQKFIPYFQKTKIKEMIEQIIQQSNIWKYSKKENFYFINLRQYLVFVQCEFNLFPLLLDNEITYYFKIFSFQNRSSQNTGISIFNKENLNIVSFNKIFCSKFQYSINLIEEECQDQNKICLKLDEMIQNFEQNNILEDLLQNKKLLVNLCNIKIKIDGYGDAFEQKEYCSLQSQIRITSTVNLIKTQYYEKVFMEKLDEFTQENKQYVVISARPLQESQNKFNQLKNFMNNSQISQDASKTSYLGEGLEKVPKLYIQKQKKKFKQSIKNWYIIYLFIFLMVIFVFMIIIKNQLIEIVNYSDRFLEYQRSMSTKNLAYCQLYMNFQFYVQQNEKTPKQNLAAKPKKHYLNEIRKYIRIVNNSNNEVTQELSQLFKHEMEDYVISDEEIEFFEGYRIDFNTQLVNAYGQNSDFVISSDNIQMWQIVQAANYLRFEDISFFQQADFEIEKQFEMALQNMVQSHFYFKNTTDRFSKILKIYIVSFIVTIVILFVLFNLYKLKRYQNIYKSFYMLSFFEESTVGQFNEKLETFNETYIYNEMTKSQRNLCNKKTIEEQSKILEDSLNKMITIENQEVQQLKIQKKKKKQLQKQITKKNIKSLKHILVIGIFVVILQFGKSYLNKKVNKIIQQNEFQNQFDTFFVQFQIFCTLAFRYYINESNQDEKMQLNGKYQIEQDFNILFTKLKRQENSQSSYTQVLDQLLNSLCSGMALDRFAEQCQKNIEYQQGIEVNVQNLLEKFKYVDTDQKFIQMQEHYDILRLGFLDLSRAFVLKNEGNLLQLLQNFYIFFAIIVFSFLIVDFIYMNIRKQKLFSYLDFLIVFLNNPINTNNQKFTDFIGKLFNLDYKQHEDSENNQ